MNKKKLSLSLGLVFLFVSSAISAIPLRVDAGSSPATGTTPDSSSSTGGNFSPANQTPSTTATPGTNVNVGSDGNISVSIVVQTNVNNAASSLVQQANNPNASPAFTAVIDIALQGSSAINNVQISLTSTGASPGAVAVLLNRLAGLFTSLNSSDTSSFTVADSQVTQLARATQRTRLSNNRRGSLLDCTGANSPTSGASGECLGTIEELTETSVLVQNDINPNVDVNQLNAAIEAYNQVINESDAETLKKLANNAEFLATGKVLKELRAALTAE